MERANNEEDGRMQGAGISGGEEPPNGVQRAGKWVGRLLVTMFFLRFPLLLAALLMALPRIVRAVPAFLGGLFDLNAWGVFSVCLILFLAVWTAIITGRLILANIGERVGGGSAGAGPEGFCLGVKENNWIVVVSSLVAGVVIAWPMVCMVLSGATGGGACSGAEEVAGCVLLGKAWGMVGLAFAAAGVIVMAAQFLELLLLPPDNRTELVLVFPGLGLFAWALNVDPWPLRWIRTKVVLPGLRRLGRYISADGYLNQAGRLLAGHLLATLYLVGLLLVYGILYWKWAPEEGPLPVPALAYALLVFVVAGWFLPAVSFFLDRYRVLTMIFLLALSAGLSVFFDTDHYYKFAGSGGETTAGVRTAAKAESLLPEEVYSAWAGHRMVEQGRVMTVVTAQGGGIQGAAWAARVLTGMEEQIPGFSRSVVLISSASGGTIGTMYYVDRIEEGKGQLNSKVIDEIVAAAKESSLAEVAWGFAYPDLWRLFPVSWREDERDRAWAMEQAWKRQLRHPEETLTGWRVGVKEGWRPATAFNATVAETGKPVVMATFDLPRAPGEMGAEELETMHQVDWGGDVSVLTAARLSATFPYVTPMSRAKREPEKAEYHIADGGYYDNFGVLTAVRWVDRMLEKTKKEGAEHALKGKTIVMLEIRSLPSKKDTEPGERSGWTYAWVGPLLLSLNVRTTTQVARNDMEMELLRAKWAQAGVEILRAVVQFEKEGAPVSWHMTREQKNNIESEWEEKRRGGEIGKVMQKFGR